MTERLYYTEPYRTEFEARVVSCERQDDRIAAVLDRTAFYPSSGGQPHDTGTLGAAQVVDVTDLDDGRVAHIIDRDLPAGTKVEGRVDWLRRFDHMQQHTGQHVLSAAFVRLVDVATVSFHLGTDVSTIDLARMVTPDELARAETEANRIVWEDRPVSIRFATAAEAADLPLRKESLRSGTLRLIEVEGFDLSACGGTHVARTGGIGLVAVLRGERFKGGTRVEFVCGGRALTTFRSLRESVAGAIRALSVLPSDLPAAVERLQAEMKEIRKNAQGLQTRLAEHDADRLVGRSQERGGVACVIEEVSEYDAVGLKSLAATIASRPGLVAVLASSASPRLVVVARSANLELSAAGILAELITRFGGRGGGRPDLAQGGGLTAPIDDIRASVEQALAARRL